MRVSIMFERFFKKNKKPTNQDRCLHCRESECNVDCKIDQKADVLIAKISENKLMQERLYATYNMMNTLLEAIPAPIFYKDINGKYLGCNKYFERFIGLSRDKIIGRTVYEIARLNWLKNMKQLIKN